MTTLLSVIDDCTKLEGLVVTAADQITNHELDHFAAKMLADTTRDEAEHPNHPSLRFVTFVPREYRRSHDNTIQQAKAARRLENRIFLTFLSRALSSEPPGHTFGCTGVECFVDKYVAKRITTVVEEMEGMVRRRTRED
jgi:hypothetical protein